MATGWRQMDGAWYYFKPDGRAAFGWTKVGDKTYYFSSAAKMYTSWNEIDGIYYYFNSDGSMKTGWINDGTHKYYMEETAGENHGKMSFGFKNRDIRCLVKVF